jgi:steroid delta-isomerase-like uncharacterized protein
MKMSSTIENVVKDFLDSFNQHDVARTVSFFYDDCVYRDMALDRTYHGKKELADFLNQLSIDFPDHKWELISILSTHNKVAFESVWSGTHTFSSIPEYSPSGNLITLKAATIMEFKDDKIYRVTDYYHLPLQKQE